VVLPGARTDRCGVATRLSSLLAVALGAALLAPACGRGDGGAPGTSDGPLPPWITAEELMPRVVEGSVVVFDGRARDAYRQGHIAGAWPLPLNEIVPPGSKLDGGAKERLAAALASTGFDPGAGLVVADGAGQDGLRRAAAGCWLLALAGARRCTLLTGGTDAWRAAGGELVSGEPAAQRVPAPVRVYARPPALASLEFVREATARPDGAIVDVRAVAPDPGGSDDHLGTIPGALRWPLPLLSVTRATGATGAIAAAFDLAALERSASAAGLFAEREPVIVGDGFEDGALGWFLLRHGLGVRDAKLFPGGVAAWRDHPALPFAAGGPRSPNAL
jgi:thiosulfate/3-mercaptopyruvate sulfurtransferase